jgi:hypothetical protein
MKVREKKLKKFPKKQLQLNAQKRPGFGSGSAIRKNARFGSALNQSGSETLHKILKSQLTELRSKIIRPGSRCPKVQEHVLNSSVAGFSPIPDPKPIFLIA